MPEVGVFTFSEEDVRSWCDGLTFVRGDALQKAGHVQAPILAGTLMSAEVQGTWTRMDRPSVEEDGATLRCTCTCGMPALCLHDAAMLLHWIRQPDAFRRPRKERDIPVVSAAERSVTPKQQMELLLHRYTMPDLRALAKTRGLSVKGQLKDEYVERLAALLLQPENIDPVLEGLGDGELIVLTLIDVLRDGAGSNAAGIRNAFHVLWGRRNTEAAARDRTVLETTLHRLEGLGLLIRPTYPGGMYDAPRAVTARTPVPQSLLDRLPERLIVAAGLVVNTPTVSIFDLMQMLAHEVRRGEVTAKLPPKPRTGYGQPPEGWEFGGRDAGRGAQGKEKRVPPSVELVPQSSIILDSHRTRLASQVGASEEQIEFAAALMLELDILRPDAGGRGALAIDEQQLDSLLMRDSVARRSALASAWLALPEVCDLRLARNALTLRMDQTRLQWYASELPLERPLRSLMARFIGHLVTAAPRWYAHSDLAQLCAIIAPDRLYRGEHALDIWWFTLPGRPDIRLALNTPAGRTQVYSAILGALLRGPLRWLGMVDVAESNAELLFQPRPSAAMLMDRDPEMVDDDGQGVSLLVEDEGDGTAVVTFSRSGDDEMALYLAAVADPLTPSPQGVRYRITGPVLQHIFGAGLSGEGLLAWLERSSQTGVPESVRRRIEHAWETFGTVRLYDDLTLVELGDDLLLSELKATTGLQNATIHVFSPRLLAVDAAQVPELLASLSRMGHRPRVLEGA